VHVGVEPGDELLNIAEQVFDLSPVVDPDGSVVAQLLPSLLAEAQLVGPGEAQPPVAAGAIS
jgi:hypothetical protein